MALTYDIKTDIRYQQGYEEGINNYRIGMIKEMLSDDLSIKQIMKYTKSSQELVEKMKAQTKK